MALIGCDYHGVNAFFVSFAEKLELFSEPFTAEHHTNLPDISCCLIAGTTLSNS